VKNLYEPLIHSSIKTIINQFHRKPDNFFNEHEFHQYCYHAFYRKKEFSRQYMTNDGKKTNVLHPEYPTLKRFNRSEPRVDPKGVRARYDMVILNPEFIAKNEFKKVRCRDIGKFDIPREYKSKNIIAAVEFKYIIHHGDQYLHEIEYDHLKLKNAEEVEQKYMLVFTNTINREIDYFKDIKRDKDIKIIYVAVFDENGKKIMRSKQIPKSWMI